MQESINMMVYLLFIMSVFYCHFITTSNIPLPKQVKPNRSSEEFCLANMLQGFPRTTSKSKSPSSRSSSAARASSHGSPKFYTPNSSPIPAVLIATATLAQNKDSKPSATPDGWDTSVAEEFDAEDLGNGHKMYLPKEKLALYKPSSNKNKLVTELLATMAEVPKMMREFKDKLY